MSKKGELSPKFTPESVKTNVFISGKYWLSFAMKEKDGGA
jgi:hypothetical protein